MNSTTSNVPASRATLWAGRIFSALPILVFLGTGIFGLLNPGMVAEASARYGYPHGTMLHITVVEIICVIIYAIPRTSILGAILLTGYLGGATATHVRAGEPFFLPIIVGAMVWLGVYFRDARLRDLVPLRSPNSPKN